MEAFVNIGTFILEDDEDIHEIMEGMLDSNNITNYRIHQSPEEFLEEMEKDADINICVIDHKLNSGMTGLDVLKKVKERNKWTYVIVMTGQLDTTVIIDYLNNGADKYVSKSGKTTNEYMDDLIQKLLIGFQVAKERIVIVEALENMKK